MKTSKMCAIFSNQHEYSRLKPLTDERALSTLYFAGKYRLMDFALSSIVNADILAGYGRITSTPTYILTGIRFPSCDFTAMQLREALAIAKQARAGDHAAVERVITIITNGQLSEKML